MNIWKKLGHFLSVNAEWFILSAGILLRLRHLLENRSLWLDEACAAVGITSASYREILLNHAILPEFARPPMMFTLLEKALVSLLGNNEIALRLFPFISAIGALAIFAYVSRKILTRRAFYIALALFAIAEPLVYYSAELKQYSTDLLCAILLLELARAVLSRGFKLEECLRMALAGAALLWLSNAMIFVLAGITFVFLLNKPWAKSRGVALALGATVLIWFISFALLYSVSLRHMVGNASIIDTWKGAFCTSPLFSLETIRWAWNLFTLSFENPVGLKWVGLMLPLFVFGAWRLWGRDRNIMLLWLMPLLFTLFAALMGKYPFYGRVLLFLTAGYYIFIAAAVDELLLLPRKFIVPVTLVFLSILFYQPVVDAGYFALHSRSKTDNRGAMEFMAEYYHPGDFIYLGTLAQPPFWYYAGKTGLSKKFPQPVIGIADGALIRGFKIGKFALDPKEIDGKKFMFFRYEYNIFDENGMFRANMGSQKDNQNISYVPLDSAYHYPSTGRTWLVLSGPSALETGVNALIIGSFNKSAKQLLAFDSFNAGVYLYDMR